MGLHARARTLTARQREIWEAFRSLTLKFGAPPSVRDVARHFRIQVSAAHRHLIILSGKGWLESRGGGLRLPGGAALPVPLLGRVPAGSPAEAVEAPEGYVPCPAEWGAGGRELFALRVRGDSMIEAGILDSDIVVVHHTERARDGDIVVAILDGAATVKRLGKHQGAPALLPANPKYKPVILRGDVRLAGRVLGVVRSLGGQA